MQWWIWALIVLAVLLAVGLVAIVGRDLNRYLRIHRM